MNFDIEQLAAQGQALVLEYGVQVVMAIVIYVIGSWIAKMVANLIKKGMSHRNVDPMVSGFVHSLVYWGAYIFVIIAALAQVGVQTASFIAVIGAAGLAVGLALQGSLSNFAAGVLMIIFKPFKTGDFVEVAGKAGSVEVIRIFNIQLKTPDNKVIIIPNSAVMDGSIVNYSQKPMRRVDLTIGVSYEAYLPDVTACLKEIVANEPKVLQEEANLIAVSELGDSSVNYVVRVWVNTPDYWEVYFRMMETVKLTFDEKGIGIPYPQMDVHLNKVD